MKILLLGVLVALILISGCVQEEGERVDTEVEIYKGVWMPTLLFQDSNQLASNIQTLKDVGVNTIFIQAFPTFSEASLELMEEVAPPGLFEKLKEVLPIEKELIINEIQTAHRNGLKVALTIGKPITLEEKDIEELNSKIIEYAILAEEYDVELFAPMGEPPDTIDTGNWRQEILSRIKEVYHGEIFWSGAMPVLPDKTTISKIPEQPPGDFSGYDYIGFTTLYMPSGLLSPEDPDYPTLEDYPEYVEGALDYMLAYAERDNCKGVIITEFGVFG
jgi:hypothetical protein